MLTRRGIFRGVFGSAAAAVAAKALGVVEWWKKTGKERAVNPSPRWDFAITTDVASAGIEDTNYGGPLSDYYVDVTATHPPTRATFHVQTYAGGGHGPVNVLAATHKALLLTFAMAAKLDPVFEKIRRRGVLSRSDCKLMQEACDNIVWQTVENSWSQVEREIVEGMTFRGPPYDRPNQTTEG